MGKTSPSRRLGKFYSSAQAAFFWAIIKRNLGWLIDVCFYTFLVKIITFDLQRVPLKIVNAPKGRQKWELQSECYQTYVKGRCLPCSTLRLFLSCRSQRNYVRMRIYALPFNMQMIFTLQSILQQIIIIIFFFNSEEEMTAKSCLVEKLWKRLFFTHSRIRTNVSISRWLKLVRWYQFSIH